MGLCIKWVDLEVVLLVIVIIVEFIELLGDIMVVDVLRNSFINIFGFFRG